MIIAFAGRKQSGKTSACEFVSNVCYGNGLNRIQIYNFADPLKEMCINILGLEHYQCYGSDHEKNELVDCYWDNKQLTAREVMQLVGTNMFRALQHNVWSEATIRRIQKDKFDLALIADCRFPNEVEAIKKAGGLVIKLNRNLYNSTHESEKALDPDQYDSSNFDLVINNQDISTATKNNLIYNFLLQKGVLLS
jgi:hypothetical protein